MTPEREHTGPFEIAQFSTDSTGLLLMVPQIVPTRVGTDTQHPPCKMSAIHRSLFLADLPLF